MSSSEAEAEFDDDDDDDDDDDNDNNKKNESEEEVLLSGLKRKMSRPKPVISYADNDLDDSEDDEDSGDDMPLAALKSNASPPKKKQTTKEPPKKKTTATATTTTATTSKPASNNKYTSVAEAFYNSGSTKGMLVQRLLARWWYAIDWPISKNKGEQKPPTYDALDGFPGVYVCTSGDKVGHILDTRDPLKAPCFRNMAKKGAEELKQLLLTALEEQKEQLILHEGKGTPTEKEIDNMIKETNKVNADKADKEAATLLKANKLAL